MTDQTKSSQLWSNCCIAPGQEILFFEPTFDSSRNLEACLPRKMKHLKMTINGTKLLEHIFRIIHHPASGPAGGDDHQEARKVAQKLRPNKWIINGNSYAIKATLLIVACHHGLIFVIILKQLITAFAVLYGITSWRILITLPVKDAD